MQCMKCGREIPAGQVFCEECLADMAKYPVKPGTAVQLPKRPTDQPAKKQSARRHPAPSPEEQVKALKRRLAAVSTALVLTLGLLAGGIYLTVDYILENEGKPLPGQNYSTEGTATEPSAG